MYEKETFEVVLQRMLNRIDNNIDKREGSVVQDMIAPAAAEMTNLYMELSNLVNFGFASELTPSNFLDLRTREFGVERKLAKKSTGKVVFYGDENFVIPIGSLVGTDDADPIYFLTTELGAIKDGSIELPVEAEIGGTRGNVVSERINAIYSNLPGVKEVLNFEHTSGGENDESDESLLQRYLDKVRKPATSGNIYQYEQWAKEVPGIGDARIYPLWNGNGTVKIIVTNYNRETPSANLIQDVYNYIESVRPIGATISVFGVKELMINLRANIILDPKYYLMDIMDEYNKSIIKYLRSIPFGGSVSISRIGALLLSINGVVDYSGLTINNQSSNIILKDDEVAKLNNIDIFVTT